MTSTEKTASAVMGKVARRHVPHAGFVMARAYSPVPRRRGGDILSLPYAALLSVYVLLSRDQVRTTTRTDEPGRAVLLVTPPGGLALSPGALVTFTVIVVGTCAATFAALVLLPVVIVAGAAALFVALVLLEVLPAAATAWRTRALARADHQARATYPNAALVQWVAAYPQGHALGDELLAATAQRDGASQTLRLSTRTQRLARWYARHGFEVVATVPLPGMDGGALTQGAVMTRRPGANQVEVDHA